MRAIDGAVMDGHVRDILDVRELGFPVFADGTAPPDNCGRGKAIETDVRVEAGGVPVSPGDTLFGDANGCIACPRDLEEAVIRKGREKIAAEGAAGRKAARGSP